MAKRKQKTHKMKLMTVWRKKKKKAKIIKPKNLIDLL